MVGLFILAAFLALVIWGTDRHLCLKDVEKDMKLHLGDLLVARDSANDPSSRLTYEAQIIAFKTLIRKNFKL